MRGVHRIEARAQLGGERRLILRRVLAPRRGPDDAVVCGALCDAQESEEPIILTDRILPHPLRNRDVDALAWVELVNPLEVVVVEAAPQHVLAREALGLPRDWVVQGLIEDTFE